MSDDLRLVLANTWPDGAASINVFGALSGRRIPLWLTENESREVLITRVTSDGDLPERITVEAHFTNPATPPPSPPRDAAWTFLGWRVESIHEQ